GARPIPDPLGRLPLRPRRPRPHRGGRRMVRRARSSRRAASAHPSPPRHRRRRVAMAPDPLPHILAKSAHAGRPAQSLVGHLSATLDAAEELRRRIGRLELTEKALGGVFWNAVVVAAVAHDTGKIAAGFQDMVTGRTRSWGHRHELLSLGFLPAL